MALNPWDRRPGETAYNYAAFLAYRDMGVSNRSLAKVAAERTASLGAVGLWSKNHDWVDRVTAYDDHLQRLADAAAVEAVITMKQEQVKIGRAVTAVAIKGLKALDPTKLSARDVAMFIKVGADLEANGRGEPVATVGVKHEGLSNETLWAMIQKNPHLSDLVAEVVEVTEAIGYAQSE